MAEMPAGGNETVSQVRTASSGVQSTYYGQPVIKAPHWRWYIINYFFLGALTGGSFLIAAIDELVDGDPALRRVARYLSIAALLPCPPLLILDLGRPERFLNMLRIVKLRSPMSLGSWALVGLSVCSSLAAGMQLLTDLTGRQAPAWAHRVVAILGMPFAAFIAGYTGVLLAITNVPLWARNYLFMGPTFVASALSGSFAAISLLLPWTGGETEGTPARMARAESICLATELSLLTAGIIHLGRLGRPLTHGAWGRLFWPLTYVGGLLLPLVLQLSGPVWGRPSSTTRRVTAALLAIAGGYSLRALMIFAGRESAARPEDYFEYTKGAGHDAN